MLASLGYGDINICFFDVDLGVAGRDFWLPSVVSCEDPVKRMIWLWFL